MLFVLQLNIPVSDSGSFLLKPLGYLQPSFHHPLLFLPTSPWMVQSERERDSEREREKAGMQEQKRERERGGGESSHALSYFFKWRRSEQRSRPKQGGTNRSARGGFTALLTVSFSSLIGQGGSLASYHAKHGWPFLPAAFEAIVTAVITVYVKTCQVSFILELEMHLQGDFWKAPKNRI